MEKFIPKYSNAQVIEELKKGNNEVVECFFYWKGPSIKELNDMERRVPGSTRRITPPICATVYRGLIKVMSQLFREEGFEYNEKVNDLYLELLEKDKFSKIEDPNRLEAWTIKTARNFYIDSIRKSNSQRIKTVVGADLSHLLTEELPSESDHKWLYTAIEKLSEEDRDLIRKLFFTPHKEKNKEYRLKLAAQMGVSIAYFYTKTSRAIERLMTVATEMLGKQAIKDREYSYTGKEDGVSFEPFALNNPSNKDSVVGIKQDIRNDAGILAEMAGLSFSEINEDEESEYEYNSFMSGIDDISGDIQCEAFILSEYLSPEKILSLIVNHRSIVTNVTFKDYGYIMESEGISIKRQNSNFSSLKSYLEKGQHIMAIVDYGWLINDNKTGYYQPLVCVALKEEYIYVYDPVVNGERAFSLEEFSNAWLQSGNFLIYPHIPISFYEPHPVDVTGVKIKQELGELVDMIAKNNHEIWADKKVRHGWKYAPFQSDERQTNPDIAPYGKISKGAKELDKMSAINSIRLIQKMGYRIVRNSPYYCRACGETVEYGMNFCPECGAELRKD